MDERRAYCEFTDCSYCDDLFILDSLISCYGGVDVDGLHREPCEHCIRKLPPYTQQEGYTWKCMTCNDPTTELICGTCRYKETLNTMNNREYVEEDLSTDENIDSNEIF